jgi:hypothetical protein
MNMTRSYWTVSELVTVRSTRQAKLPSRSSYGASGRCQILVDPGRLGEAP